MIARRISRIALLGLAAGLSLSACQPYRNFTTFFNLFYNIERINGEVENEMAWMRDEKSPEPVYFIPYDDVSIKGGKAYNHLERRSTTEEEMRANKIKLDSILIKGSKLLARNAKSDYVDGAVFYIGKAYFYLHEWYQSQKKYEELIANFPESKYFPDAHLYLSMDMMHQGNVEGARTMLSRTIDIAWGRKRLDVLTDAFRLNADLELGEGDIEKALKPYRRAMLLSNDDEDHARWEYEMGVIYFRAGDFENALKEFDKVADYSPETIIEFQSGLQRAVTLRTLNRFEEAQKQLAELRRNGNYESWWGLVDVERNNLAADNPAGADQSEVPEADSATAATSKSYVAYGVYERSVKAFRRGDYRTALEGFTKVQNAVAPFQRRAQRYVALLNQYFRENVRVAEATRIPLDPFPDSTKAFVAEAYYSVARVFAAIGIPDSLRRYNELSLRWAPAGSPEAARAIYANAQMAREDGRTAYSDSLLEVLVHDYGLTDYAADARVRLGYTESAKIDVAEDLYTSGLAHMRVNEDTLAISQFHRVIEEYPTSNYAPKAYYAIGLLYEQRLNDRDSAFSYYAHILETYPNSDQAVAVKPIIDAVLAARQRESSAPAGDGTDGGGTDGGGTDGGTRLNPGNGNGGGTINGGAVNGSSGANGTNGADVPSGPNSGANRGPVPAPNGRPGSDRGDQGAGDVHPGGAGPAGSGRPQPTNAPPTPVAPPPTLNQPPNEPDPTAPIQPGTSGRDAGGTTLPPADPNLPAANGTGTNGTGTNGTGTNGTGTNGTGGTGTGTGSGTGATGSGTGTATGTGAAGNGTGATGTGATGTGATGAGATGTGGETKAPATPPKPASGSRKKPTRPR